MKINEMPRQINNLHDEIRKFKNNILNHQAYHELIMSDLKFLCNYNQACKVYYKQTGSRTFLFYGLKESDNYIGYFAYIEIQSNSLLKNSWCTQTLVWSCGNDDFSGISNWMIFNQYLPKFKTIMTDSFQSPDGERLWTQIVSKTAFKKNLNVYLLDFNEGEFELIKNVDSFDAILEDDNLNPWGKSAKHENLKLAISLIEL